MFLNRAMSMSIDMPDADYQSLQLSGSWSRERYVKTRDLAPGITAISSMRGNSSHQHNPFLALKRKSTTECSGEAYGFSLIYSGNFLAEVELDQYDQLRLVMGLNPKQFVYELKPGETFEGPEAVMAFTRHGFTALSHLYHDFYRTNLCRSKFVSEVQRPVLINSWGSRFHGL